MQMVFGLPLQVGVTGDAEYMDINLEGDAAKRLDAERDEIPAGPQSFDAADSYTGRDIVDRLNTQLPPGIRITASRVRRSNHNVMSIVTHALYEMRIGCEYPDSRPDGALDTCGPHNAVSVYTQFPCEELYGSLKKSVRDFLQPGARIINRDSGKRASRPGIKAHGVKSMDLAPLVRHMEARGDMIVMTVSAGSVNNVKPDFVLEALNVLREQSGGANKTGKFVKISLNRKALYVEREGVLYKPVDEIICG
jgi:hypothetical protein